MKAIVFAVLAGLCWGVGEIFSKNVLNSGQVGPMAVLVVRTALAVPPALLAFFIASRAIGMEPYAFWQADRPVLAQLLLGSALLAGFGGVFFFYLSLRYGEITVVKPISFTLAPALAVLFGWLVLKESMSLQKGVGIVLILGGLVVLTTAHTPGTPRPPLPDSQATP